MRISAYIDLVSTRCHICLCLYFYKAQRFGRCLKTAGTRPHKQRIRSGRCCDGVSTNTSTAKNSFSGVVIVIPGSTTIAFRNPRINALHCNLAVRAGCRNCKRIDLVVSRYLFIDCEIFCLACTQQFIFYCQCQDLFRRCRCCVCRSNDRRKRQQHRQHEQQRCPAFDDVFHACVPPLPFLSKREVIFVYQIL